jgi:transcriptional regulator with XRE-family HTH domain
MTLIEMLDKAKERTGSDPKTAERIGISKGLVSQTRSGNRPLPPDACVELADLLGLPWHVVFAAAEAHHSKDEKRRQRWSERAGRFAAIACIIAVGLVASPEAYAAAAGAAVAKNRVFLNTFSTIHYSFCRFAITCCDPCPL